MEIEHVHIERGAEERGSMKGQGLNASPEFDLSTGVNSVKKSPPKSLLTDSPRAYCEHD